MIDLSRSPNRLISGLESDDQALLKPYLSRGNIPFRCVLEKPNRPIERIHFIESGFASLVASTSGDRTLEVALIGREGMTGIAYILGTDRSPNECVIQVEGTSLSLDVEAFSSALQMSTTLRDRLLLYVQALFIQASQTALANGRAQVEQRLTRWLVMAHDRIDGDELALTHELLAVILGARRAGVTVALHNLEGEKLIRSTRGVVTVLDRERLENYADGLYGVAEAEYERLLGPTYHAAKLRGMRSLNATLDPC